MLDFDKNEVFEGFEGEFKKKKRVRRSMGNFPSWGLLLILLAVAGAVYGYFRGAFTPDTSIASQTITVTAKVSTKLPAATPSVVNSTLTAEPATIVEPTSESVLPEEVSGIRLDPTAPVLPTSKPNLIQQIVLLFNPEKDPDVTPKPTATPRPQPEKLNFFQSILHALNPDWLRGATATLIPVKSATPQLPAPTALSEETDPPAPTPQPGVTETARESIATFPATVIPAVVSTQKATATAIVLPGLTRTVTAAAAGTVISGFNLPGNSEKTVTVTPLVLSTALRMAATSMEPTPESPVLTLPVAARTLPAAAATVAMVIETAIVPADTSATVTAPAALTLPATDTGTGTVQSSPAASTIVPVIVVNEPTATEMAAASATALPSATMTAVPSATTEPTATQAPSPTPEPTRSPGFFQRFIDSLFPRRTPVPTATATATMTAEPTVTPSQTALPGATLTEAGTASQSFTPTADSQPESQRNTATQILPTESSSVVSAPVTAFQVLNGKASATVIPSPTGELEMVPSATGTAFVPRRDETAAPVVKATSTADFTLLSTAQITEQPSNSKTSVVQDVTAAIPTQTSQSLTPTNFGMIPTIAPMAEATLEQKQSDLFDEPLFFEEDTPVAGAPATAAPTVTSTHSAGTRDNLSPVPTNNAVPLKSTDAPVYQPTRLPDTGFADQWNIPMMILVVMVLLALILTVRLLRNKR